MRRNNKKNPRVLSVHPNTYSKAIEKAAKKFKLRVVKNKYCPKGQIYIMDTTDFYIDEVAIPTYDFSNTNYSYEAALISYGTILQKRNANAKFIFLDEA